MRTCSAIDAFGRLHATSLLVLFGFVVACFRSWGSVLVLRFFGFSCFLVLGFGFVFVFPRWFVLALAWFSCFVVPVGFRLVFCVFPEDVTLWLCIVT